MGTAIGEIVEKQAISLDELSGRMLGIDSFNILYQFLSTIRSQDGSLLMDSKGNVTSHLTGLLYRTSNLLQREVKPVFVFDGKPHKLKGETTRERNRIRTEAGKKMVEARKKGDLAEAKKFAQQASKLDAQMIADAKKLVQLLGLPVIEAPSEGEAQISWMVKEQKLFGGVSQDFDCLLFGCPLLFRNITITGRRKLPGRNVYVDISPEKIELEKTLNALQIDRKKLIWMGILIGTDFNEKFPKIGVKTALKLVQQCNSFEEIIKETAFKPEFDFKEIEEIFLKPQFTNEFSIKFGKPDKEKTLEFLVEEHDFSKERVENVLNKLIEKTEEESSQAKLNKWF